MNDITLEDLPKQAREIADLIGLEATLRLVSVYGGMTLSFSSGKGPVRAEIGTRRDIIEKLIGKAKTALLFKHYASEIVYLPRCASALKRVRDVEICSESDEGATLGELAAKHRLTERQVWTILKDSSDKK